MRDVGGGGALVLEGRGSCPAAHPSPRQGVLLADARPHPKPVEGRPATIPRWPFRLAAPRGSPSRRRAGFFEGRQGGWILLVMARAHRQLAEAEAIDQPSERALVQADAKARVDPGG